MESIAFLVIIALGFYAYLLKEKSAEIERKKHAEIKSQLDAAEKTKVRLLDRVEELRPKPADPFSTVVDTTNDAKLADAVQRLEAEIKRQHPDGPSFLSVLIEMEKSLRVISNLSALKHEIEQNQQPKKDTI